MGDGPGTTIDPPPWESRLADALTASLASLPASTARTILFSGGLDSGLLAWELRHEPSVTLSTIGREGSGDFAAAEPAARTLGLPWSPHQVTEQEVRSVAARIDRETKDLGPTARSVEVALALAVEHSPPGRIVCGQGADELFLGYAHFRGPDGPSAEARAAADLTMLLAEAWPRSRRIAASLGRTIEAPYLDARFVRAAQEIPLAERMAGPAAKQAFRNFARRRGLPDSLALRPKKALQYGSGVERLLRRPESPADRPR